MFCPKVQSECIKEECYAFQVISVMKCNICEVEFNLGASCNEEDHKRTTDFVKSECFCKEYDCSLNL